MLSFNFGGKNSFSDYGIYITSRPSIPTPKRKISNVNIPGRNSSLKFDENKYEDITITVKCSVKGTDYYKRIDEINGWLYGLGEDELIFSFDENKKYIAQVVNAIEFSQVLRYFSDFVIVFNCQPFKYDISNSNLVITKPGVINNIGNIYSEPIIKVTGSGNIVLSFNNQVINLYEVNEKLIIDSVIQNCYNEKLENMNYKMNGEFPVLESGENNISWTGNISNLEVTPNWRWL